MTFVLACAVVTIHAIAAETPREPAPSAAQIEQWVRQLDHRSFAARELASKNLLKSRGAAIEALAVAAAQDSLEVTDRSIRILDELASSAFGKVATDAKAKLVLLAASDHVAASARAKRVLRGYQFRVAQALELCGASVQMEDDRITGVYFDEGDPRPENLRLLQELPDLEYLSFCTPFMDDAGLAELQGLPRLRELNLYRSRVSDAGLKYLKTLPNLRRVPMGETRVTDEGLVHLKDMAQLEYVGLRGNRITDAGLVHLSKLKLTGLHLGETQVTDAGLVHLRRLTGLNTLYLAQTKVSDAGLDDLKVLAALRNLDLSGSQVTDDGVARLKQSLPHVQVLTKQPTLEP